VAYEPAFGIIGDPAKRKPTTRQSADHSMVFIVSRLILKAIRLGTLLLVSILLLLISILSGPAEISKASQYGTDGLWQKLILAPEDFGREALQCQHTRALMDKISFEHGGPVC
jgi:2-methylcitrate dehydratase